MKITAPKWISLVNPNSEEIIRISKKHSIPVQMLNYALDENEPPRTDSENGNTLILCKIPVKDPSSGFFETIPLGIIINQNTIITITLKTNQIIDNLKDGNILEKLPGKITFLFYIFNRINFYFLNYLRFLEKEIDETEKNLLCSFSNNEITGLLKLQKTLVYFNTATLSNRNVLEKIAKGGVLTLSPEESNILDDVMVENRQAQEMINIHTNILSDTMDAYTSIISNNLNKVMKFLTSFTIILSLPTMIASYYGMNVLLPFQQHPYAFPGIIAASILLMLAFALFFSKKKYF